VKNINEYIRAQFNIILLITHEDERFIREQKAVRTHKVVVWSFSKGIGEKEQTGEPVDKVLKHIMEYDNPVPTVFVLRDYQPFLKLPGICARIKDLNKSLRKNENIVIMTSPRRELPPELEEVVTILDYDLPDREMLGELVQRAASVWKEDKVGVEKVADALAGLSELQASNALSLSRVVAGKIDVDTILVEKARSISQDGIIETIQTNETLDDVAGYDALTSWLINRRKAFSKEARDYGLPTPKGTLLVGIPGGGKSLVCKAVSKAWGLPLLKCDIGSLFAGVVGASEANIRKMIKTAEAASPCVLWLDEIEKSMSSSIGQSSGDSGTSARVLATIITWLQEKTKPVFVIATANRPEALPVELLRKGRWDDLWALDLPNERGRGKIYKIHIRKRGRDPESFDIKALVESSNGFTGAEIEATVVEALYKAFNDGQRDITTEDILKSCGETIPLSLAAGSEIEGMRAWAKGRARNASGEESPQLAEADNRFSGVN